MEKTINDSHEEEQNRDAPDLQAVDGLVVAIVTWWRHPGLRKLYSMMPILLIGATINGYDGSLLNGLQTMDPWQDCKPENPLDSRDEGLVVTYFC